MFQLDQQLFNLIHQLAGKSRFLDFFAILFADYLGYFLILAALFLIFSLKKIGDRYYYFLFTALTLVISRGILTEIVRYFFPQNRPFVALSFNPLISHEASYSFPSGHAAFFFALAFSMFFLNRRWGIALSIGALIISIARVFAGVHWPMDIVGGVVVSLVGLLIANFLLKPKENINESSSAHQESF